MSSLQPGVPYVVEAWRKETFNWAQGLIRTRPADLVQDRIITLGVPGRAGAARTLRLSPFGMGDENDVFNYRVWLLRYLFANSSTDQLQVGRADLRMDLLCFGAATMATVAPAGSVVALSVPVSSDGQQQLDPPGGGVRICDTLTLTMATASSTPRGAGSAIVDSAGAEDPFVYSPTNNEWAELYIPDAGGVHAVAVEVQSADADIMGGFVVEAMV